MTMPDSNTLYIEDGTGDHAGMFEILWGEHLDSPATTLGYLPHDATLVLTNGESGTSGGRIEVGAHEATVHLTMSNLKINNTMEATPLGIERGATLDLSLDGRHNECINRGGERAGVSVDFGAYLTIRDGAGEGIGQLYAKASNYSRGYGSAGIGANDGGVCGSITILSGKIDAVGSGWGAGIGSCNRYKNGDVLISGGTVIARRGGGYHDVGFFTSRWLYGYGISASHLVVTGGSVCATTQSGDAESLNGTGKDGNGSDTSCYHALFANVPEGTDLSGATLRKSDGSVITYGADDLITAYGSLHGGYSDLYLYLADTSDIMTITTADGTTFVRTTSTQAESVEYGESYIYRQQYQVSFNANGGTGSMKAQSFTAGTSQELTKSSFTRSGCFFLGWSRTKDAERAEFTDEQEVDFLEKDATSTINDVTLYAVWARLGPVSISYQPSGMGKGKVSISAETLDSQTGEAKGSSAVATPGYTFVNWTDEDENVVSTDARYVPIKPAAGWVETTYTANFKGNSYSVKFNANGGQNSMSDETMTYATEAALTANTYVRTGYTFAGWNTQADGTGVSYTDGQVVKNLTTEDSVTLYAQWKANTFTLHFGYEGSDATMTGTMADETMTYDVEKALTPNAFKRTGYHFVNWEYWWTSSSTIWGEKRYYDDGALVKNTTNEDGKVINLWAQWEANSYMVSFDANDGAGETMATEDMTYNTTKALTTNTYVRTGYTFAGWNTQADGTGDSYTDAQAVKNLTAEDKGSVILYAQWQANPYTVHFEPGATDATGTMDDEAGFSYGTAKALTGNAFKRPGYSFLGWKVADTSRYVADGAEVTDLATDGTVTLTATWEALPDALLSYNVADKAQGSVSLAHETLVRGTGTPAGSTATDAAGYSFSGWTVYGSTVPFSTDATLTADAIKGTAAWSTDHYVSTDFVANFSPNTYAVTFDASYGTGSMDTQTMTYGTAAPLTANAYVRTGYTFVGWSKTKGGTTVDFVDKDSVKDLATGETGDTSVTLYAVWTPNTYTVSFSGTGSIGSMPDQVMTFNVGAKLRANTLSRTGYTFAGWSTTEGGTVVYADKAGVTNLATSGTVPLYAVWTANTYAIAFDANGGTGSTMANEPMTYDVEAPLTTNSYTRANYTFTGWNTKADGTGTPYAAGASVKNLAASGTTRLYAQWEGDAYLLTFKGGAASGADVFQDMIYGSSANLTKCGFAYADHTFLGWALSESPSTVTYRDGQLVSDLGTTELTAVWAERALARLSYATSDVAKGTVSAAAELVKPDSGESKGSTATPAAGYHLVGWASASDPGKTLSTEATFEAPKPTTGGYVDASYVAVFQEDAPVTITYAVSEGGTVSSTSESVAPATGEASGSTAAPSVGHHLREWTVGTTTQVAGTDDTLTPTQVTVVAKVSGIFKATTFTAVFDVNTYGVSFDANEGTGSMDPLSVTYGTATAAPSSTMTRVGYTFSGWNTSADGTGTPYAVGADLSGMDAEDGSMVTLYAQWAGVPYTATFDANGGTGTIDPLAMTYGTPAALPASGVTRVAFHLVGWNTEADGSGTSYLPGQSVSDLMTVAGGEVPLYAMWESNAYEVRFDANGGTGSMDALPMSWGTASALPSCGFTRDGYTFSGWNTAADGTGTSYADGAEVKDLATKAGITTLYAQWSVATTVIPVSDTTTTPQAVVPLTSDPFASMVPLVLAALAVVALGLASRRRRRS